MDEKMISVIIPISIKAGNEWLFDRLDYPLLDDTSKAEIEFIYVDYGSAEKHSKKIQRFCADRNCKYLQVKSADMVLSFSAARNKGASAARGEYLLFLDVDLITYDGFYDLVASEIQTIYEYEDANECAFIMLPVIYLTERGNQKFFEVESQRRKSFFMEDIYDQGPLTERYSSGTSAVVVSRYTFCALGGYPEEFLGWGGEDIVFNNRLIRAWAKYPIPEHFSSDIGSMHGINVYQGWKSMYRLHGDRAFHKGLILFHAWHPVNMDTTYKDLWKTNKESMNRKILKARTPWSESPLPYNTEETAIIIDENSFTTNTKVLPFWGKWVTLNKEKWQNSEDAVKHIIDSGAMRVVFHNPYKSKYHRELYDAVRSSELKYTVCERGAITDSLFYDNHGFNFDSRAYHPENWSQPLSENESEQVCQYIAFDKKSFNSLEAQKSNEIGNYREKRGIPKHRKILFVPLQRFTDTVTREFTAEWRNYFDFVENIMHSIPMFDGSWQVVVKPHPLEDIVPKIPGAIIEKEAHFKEILLASDAVYTLNSGVGVYGLMYDKPVFVSGGAFYEGPGLAEKVKTLTDILDFSFDIDVEARRRFVHFLVHKFYSFGQQVTRNVIDDNGFRMTATTDVDLYQVVVDGTCKKLSRSTKRTPEGSLLFDRYLDKRKVARQSRSTTLKPIVDQKLTVENDKIVSFSAGNFRVISGKIYEGMIALTDDMTTSLILAEMHEDSVEEVDLSILVSALSEIDFAVEVEQNGTSVVTSLATQNHKSIISCKIKCYLPLVVRIVGTFSGHPLIEDVTNTGHDFKEGILGRDAFDEQYYFAQNPDVLLAVESGEISDAYTHFRSHGIFEGREFRFIGNVNVQEKKAIEPKRHHPIG